jgi:enamine deaminase RidA (YjgF/YER057c/UK114 family)
MSKIEDRIKELGLELPPTPKPVAAYVPAVQTGNIVFTAGQLPRTESGLVAAGLVPSQTSVETAAAGAQVCALNALAAIKGLIGDLDKIQRIVKVVVFVASDSDFGGQPTVANGASEVLQKIFEEKGQHARSALGVAALPINASVEVELIVEVG